MDTPESTSPSADEQKEIEESMTEIRAMLAEIRKHVDFKNAPIDDDLYDEWGAPK
jgi:hypothetical protein